MSFLVSCTFDLKGGSSLDYQNAYDGLKKLGLEKVVVSDAGSSRVIPTTMTLGTFSGTSAISVATSVRSSVANVFSALRLSAEIFVTAGANGAWAAQKV